MVTALKSSTPCHLASIAFENCVLLFGRKVVPRYLVGVLSTEVTFSMQCACLGRRNRKSSVFLASSDVEVSSLLPCCLDVPRFFTFGGHSPSVSVALHRHFIFLPYVLPRSCSDRKRSPDGLLLAAAVLVCCISDELASQEKGQRIHLSQLVSVLSHTVPPSTRGYVQMTSRGISFWKLNSAIIDSNLHPCPCQLKSRHRPRAPREFLICHCVMGRWNLQVH